MLWNRIYSLLACALGVVSACASDGGLFKRDEQHVLQHDGIRDMAGEQTTANIIQDVYVSKTHVLQGETFFVRVLYTQPGGSSPLIRIAINGVDGAYQYRQLTGHSGPHTLFVTAYTDEGKVFEERPVAMFLRDFQPPDIYPLIYASPGQFGSRSINFAAGNASDGTSFTWDFGDGGVGRTEGGATIEHDYTDALARDERTSNFNVSVVARYNDNNMTIESNRTVAVFNLYAHHKRRGILTPRASLRNNTRKVLMISPARSWTIDIKNLEDEEINFTQRRIELIDSDPDSNNAIGRPSAIKLVIGGRSVGSHTISMANNVFKKSIYGFAVHFDGVGVKTGTPATSSIYIQAKNPKGQKVVFDPKIRSALDGLSGLLKKDTISHLDLRDVLRQPMLPPVPPPRPFLEDIGRLPLGNYSKDAVQLNFTAPPAVTTSRFDPRLVSRLVDGGMIPFDFPSGGDKIIIGEVCDPDNVPDVLPEGTTCQFSGTYEWQFIPGHILNAKKGDVLMSPSGSGVIGQLLSHVSPPQYYAHCGIMTKNHIEVRHSTGSDDWLKDHPRGSFAGHQGVDGFDLDALRYVWPGTVTQSIDKATLGGYMPSPEGKQYLISPFSFHPDRPNDNTLALPLVLKPQPMLETQSIRKQLHSIADAAVGIKGHYRFYGYTRPEVALEPQGAGKGWAEGTIATVCSSFIWLACRAAGVHMEGNVEKVTVGDLEVGDIVTGAYVNQDTLDGLYRYSAAVRRSAADWLYDYIYHQAYDVSGWLGRLFTDAPDNVANQIVNAFASDYIDEGSMNSDAWKQTADANAVSPDNLFFWDSPAPGNQKDFRSVYGHPEELFYEPGTYDKAPVYRWTFTPMKGKLAGLVVSSAGDNVEGATVSFLGSGLQDIVVGADGRFAFPSEVPAGTYSVTAGLAIRGQFYRTTQPVTITASQTTTVVLTLNPPPEVNRAVVVTVHMESTNTGVWACGTCTTYFDQTQTLWLHPFNSHGSLGFDYRIDDQSYHGAIYFNVDLNADLSVTVTWSGQLKDDDDLVTHNDGAGTVPKDYWQSWSGLGVSHSSLTAYHGTVMSWTVENNQG